MRYGRISAALGTIAALSLACGVGLSGCGGGGGDDGDKVDPANVDQVMNNILVKMGGVEATQQSGSPPTPTGNADSPKALAGTDAVTMTTGAGSTVDIPVNFQATQAMNAIFGKIGNSTTFFQATSPVGGKGAKAVPVSGAGQNFVIQITLKRAFREGTFCFDFNGTDGNGLVSNFDSTCVHLVDQITQTGLDQPSADVLASSLEGNWLSTCLDFRSPTRSGSAQIGFTFAADRSYTEFLEIWDVSGCPGHPNTMAASINGNLQIGQTAVFLPTASGSVQGFWALPVDFIPDQASQSLGAHTCFNVMRFINSNPDRFYLGVPLGFSVASEADSPAPCASVASRPDYLSSAIAFNPVDTLPPLNMAPVANAGPDQTVGPGVVVTLTSAGSADADGTFTRQWTQTGGTAVTLSSATAISPTFTAPATNGPLTFTLTVTDNGGLTAEDTVTVNVATNAAPTANAGPDLFRRVGSSVQISGSGTDADGTVASFAWTQTGGSTVTLTGANTANLIFTAPATPADLTFQLTVTDNKGATGTDTVIVHVLNDAPPTANAGADQSVKSGDTVTLHGSGTDSDGTVASFRWTQTGGPTVTLSSATAQNPTFSTSGITALPAVLTFQLVTTDDENLQSAPDTVTITVHANLPPVAEAGPSQRFAQVGDTVTLSGAASTDADGTIVSYHWDEIFGPQMTLRGADTATLTYTAPNASPDNATFQLTVTDDSGATGTDTVNVKIIPAFKLAFSTTNFTADMQSFTFTIQGNHVIGNLFTDQSSVQPFPEGPVFDDLIVNNGNCTVASGQINCNDSFVKRYLGGTIDGCNVDATSKAVIATVNNTTGITFTVDCKGVSALQGLGNVGIGLNGGQGPFQGNNARSAQTGHQDSVTNICTPNGCNQQ